MSILDMGKLMSITEKSRGNEIAMCPTHQLAPRVSKFAILGTVEYGEFQLQFVHQEIDCDD